MTKALTTSPHFARWQAGDLPRGEEVRVMDGVALGSFGKRNFHEVDLGDVRRTRRLVELVDAMCRRPGGTLPDKLSEPCDLRAFYRMMDAPAVTHAAIMTGVSAATRREIDKVLQEGAVVLIVHDATELDYTSKPTLHSQLGQIGQGTHRGYICHNSLALRAETREVLGLGSQILHHRADVPKKETEKQKRERQDRESRLWPQGAKQCGTASCPGLVVDVSDSLSDTFEYMAYEVGAGRHFVLRHREDRKLATPVGEHQYLVAAVRSWRSRVTETREIQGTKDRQTREASLSLSFGRVTIAPPGRRSGEYPKIPLPLWAVRVWERNPPPDVDPLEWILLTNVPVGTTADAKQRVQWYEGRVVIEEFHKGMKTGCGIESLQFDKIQRLEPAIAVLSAVATTLLKLRDAARQPDADQRPATDVVDPVYVKVLARHYAHRMGPNPTARVFYMHVARLGGHQNRKCDGFPGWLTLWRGWMKLQDMVNGHELATRRQKRCGKT